MRRGEVWWANLPAPWGRRPVLLLSRDGAYELLTWVVVAIVTTNIRDIPSTVRLEPGLDGVPRPSIVNLDSILAVRKEWLESQATRLRPEKMQAVDRAIHFALGLRNCP